MTAPILADDRIEALRRRLALGDPRPAEPAPGPAGSAAMAPAPAPLPRRPGPLAKVLVKRYAGPVADPILHRLAHTVTPTVAAMVAERLLGRLEPEVDRLAAELAVVRAEVAAGDDRRTRARLDDLTHRLNRLEPDR